MSSGASPATVEWVTPLETVNRHRWLFCSLAFEFFYLQNWPTYESHILFFLEASAVEAQKWANSLGILLDFCREPVASSVEPCFAPLFIPDYAGIGVLDYSSWTWLVLWSVEDKETTSGSNWILFPWRPWRCKSNLHNRFTVEVMRALAVLCAPELGCPLYGSRAPRIPLVFGQIGASFWMKMANLSLTDVRSLNTGRDVYCPPIYQRLCLNPGAFWRPVQPE